MFKWQLWPKLPVLTRYGLAIVSVGLSVLISEFVESRWKSSPFVSVFTCAIVLSAWFGGFGPGLLSVALSILAFDYYFLPPTHSLVPNSHEVPRLILFAIAALIVGLLSAAQRGSAETPWSPRANNWKSSTTNTAMARSPTSKWPLLKALS